MIFTTRALGKRDAFPLVSVHVQRKSVLGFQSGRRVLSDGERKVDAYGNSLIKHFDWFLSNHRRSHPPRVGDRPAVPSAKVNNGEGRKGR